MGLKNGLKHSIILIAKIFGVGTGHNPKIHTMIFIPKQREEESCDYLRIPPLKIKKVRP